MPPARERGGLDWFAATGADCGQPAFGLLSKRSRWCCVLIERGRVVYTLLLDVITKTLARYCFRRTDPESNGAALSLGISGQVCPIATVARCLGVPFSGMRGLIHVT